MQLHNLVSVLLLVVLGVPSSGQSPKRRGGKLKPGDAAVDVTLQDALGKKTIKISELKGKPVVLIFGSSTSPRLVNSIAAINKLYAAYQDVVHIYVVYVRESPGKKDVDVPAPKTLEQRRQVAHTFSERVGLSAPVLVDAMDNRADNAYAGWPDRLYVIDAAGAVVHKSNYTLDGFGPALSATPFILYQHTNRRFADLPGPAPIPETSRRSRESQEGAPAADFTLHDPQGKNAVKLSELKGKPVVLIFGSCT